MGCLLWLFGVKIDHILTEPHWNDSPFQTALGKESPYDKIHYMEEPDEGYNSTRANGNSVPDKRFDAALPIGKSMMEFP